MGLLLSSSLQAPRNTQLNGYNGRLLLYISSSYHGRGMASCNNHLFFPNTQGNGTPRTASGCWHPKIRFRPIPELLVAHRLWAVPSASSNSDQTCDLFLAICVIWYSTRPGRTVHAELADSEHLVITSAWLAVISPRPASGHSKGNDRPTSIYASHHCQIHQFSPFFHILS